MTPNKNAELRLCVLRFGTTIFSYADCVHAVPICTFTKLARAVLWAHTARMDDSSVKSPSLSAVKLPIPLWEFVSIIAALLALNALAIDSMLPALDDIARAFSLEDSNAQQNVIFAYILGYGTPQLVFGPLSDRIGRRNMLRVCLLGYTIIGFTCMFASSFGILLAMRFSQGVFSAGVRVAGVSIVRDLMAGRAMAKVMSLVMTVFMIVPIIAPIIGQGVLMIASWEWTFGILGIGGFLTLIWVHFRLPETLPPKRRKRVSIPKTAAAYVRVLEVRETFGYMLASGIIFGSLFAFIGASEQIFTEVFDKESSFVFYFAGVAGLLAVSNFTNARVVERIGMRRISHGALFGFIAFSTLNIVLAQFTDSFWAFYIPFTLAFACYGLIGANFSAIAMEAQGDNAGTASAAYGFATTTLAGLLGWLIARQFDGSIVPIMAGFVALGVASLIIVIITEKGRLFERRKGRKLKR